MAPPKKRDVLTQFSKLSPVMKMLVLIIVTALVFLIYWQFVYSDLRAEKKSEQDQRSSLLGQQASLHKRVDDLVTLKEKRDKLKDKAATIEFALPSNPEINAFLDDLQTKAGIAQVSFKSWKQNKEIHVDKYEKMPLEVTVEGTFYQLLKYFSLLGPPDERDQSSLDDGPKFDRPRTVENLKIAEAAIRNDEIILSATFTAATFRQKAPEPPPGATKAKPGKAAPKTGGGGFHPPGQKPPSNIVEKTKQNVKTNLKKEEKFVKDNVKSATKAPGAKQ